MRDGLHAVLASGQTVHFYFNGLSLDDYLAVASALARLYSGRPGLLEIFDA